METQEAFASLLKAATAEFEKVQQEGSAYFARGDIAHVRESADRVERIKRLISSLEQIQSEWVSLLPDTPPLREPQVDHSPVPPSNNKTDVQPKPTPRTLYTRTPSGIRTNQTQFEIPILQVLVEMGGKGRVQNVLDRLEKKMDAVLNDTDRQLLQSRGEVRWRNTASWARVILGHSGYLSSTSPQGMWEITSEGRRYLE
jgi:hypothetical protein